MIFDPHTGDGSAVLVYSASDAGRYERPSYAAIRAEREQDQREREYRALMQQRTGVCG